MAGQSELGFHCKVCGEFHAEMPFRFGAEAPAHYDAIAAEDRASRCEFTGELCVIDEKNYFIRGCLEIPVIGSDVPFDWGVWASLSEHSFKRVVEAWDLPDRASEPPYYGWLSTSLPLYPPTLSLKTHVHMRGVGTRPYIELEPTEHPLAVEQRDGITLDRVREIAEMLLHNS